MAEARLKEQVRALEGQLRTMSTREKKSKGKRPFISKDHLPMVVCDTSMFLYKLPLVQKWVRRSMCQVVLVAEGE